MDEKEEIEETEEEKFEVSDLFLSNLNSTLFVKTHHDKKAFDYGWLDIIEETVPYIDNILRNPKRFIVNDEEIVKVELSRKVTVESVIHLTQHTNLIQKIEDNGDVKPSKILNVNKEESLDTYENRFVYTLIVNLRMFFENRIEATSGPCYCIDKNSLTYEANSKVNGQDLKVSIDISDNSRDVKENMGSKNNMTLDERLRKLKTQIDGFFGTELMQTLSRLHVAPVRSPIKKTNVILKNPNFQKAEALWNYIQSFVSKDIKEKSEKEYYDDSILKNEYDQAFLTAFLANKNYINHGSGDSEENIIRQMIERLIDNLLETDIRLTEDEIAELFKEQIDISKVRNDKRRQKIFTIFDSCYIREEKKLNDLLDNYRKEDLHEENFES